MIICARFARNSAGVYQLVPEEVVYRVHRLMQALSSPVVAFFPPNKGHMPVKPITSDRLAKPAGPFSPAVRDGDRVYTSGQVAQDPATGQLIAGGVAAQTEQIFHNLAVILSAADKSLGDVVKVNVYLTDMRDFAAMNDVYARHFAPPYPARTTVAVAALPLGAHVEIETIAG